MLRLILLPFICLSYFTCKPIPFEPNTLKQNYIHFGNGGGFTGAVTAFYLTTEGKLYKMEGSNIIQIGETNQNITDQMFSLPKTLNVKNNPYNVPGNKYFFIEYFIDNDLQKIVWGGDQNHPKSYETWYHNLMHIVKIEN
ncbi:MAG: hypothetical protein WAT79_09460 [Saprospiraceae bacterium]